MPAQEIAEWSQADRFAWEKEVLGVYLSGHTLDEFRSQLSAITYHASSSLQELADSTPVVLVGMLSELKIRKSRKGNPWGTGALEDLFGHIELVVLAEAMQAFQALQKSGGVAVIKGRVRCEAGARPKVLVGGIVALNESRVH